MIETIEEAQRLQEELRRRVRVLPLEKEPGYIAGVDASFHHRKVIGCVCLYTYPGLIHIEDRYALRDGVFPYIPGYLSFREGPVMIDAINALSIKPDLILFDGQGIAHPRSLGIASHIGVILDIPSIGCAKSSLVGSYKEPGPKKGDHTPIVYRGRRVGYVLRTRDRVKPVFVSPGHRIDFKDSLRIVLNCTRGYRIPEPLRCADQLSKRIKTMLPEEKGR